MLFEDGQKKGNFLNQGSTSFEMEKEDEDEGNDLELDLVGSFLSDVCGIASTSANLRPLIRQLMLEKPNQQHHLLSQLLTKNLK